MMPILQRETGQSATRKILLTTALGILFGLLFGIPPALALQRLGFIRLAYVAVAMALLVGLSLAYSLVGFVIAPPVAPPPTEEAPPRNTTAPPPCANRTITAVDKRLADAKACLDAIDDERQHLGRPAFGETTEQRMIWRELLDLELQDIDEQMDRIRHEESVPGRSS
jgi:hypothetical protein